MLPRIFLECSFKTQSGPRTKDQKFPDLTDFRGRVTLPVTYPTYFKIISQDTLDTSVRPNWSILWTSVGSPVLNFFSNRDSLSLTLWYIVGLVCETRHLMTTLCTLRCTVWDNFIQRQTNSLRKNYCEKNCSLQL